MAVSHYTGVDPNQNVPTVQPNLTVHLNGLREAQAALLTPKKSSMNVTVMFPLHGQPNLTVHFNSLGVAQAAPRTQTCGS